MSITGRLFELQIQIAFFIFTIMSAIALLSIKLLQLPGVGHRTTFEVLRSVQERADVIDNTSLAHIIQERMAGRIAGVNILSFFDKGEELYQSSLRAGTQFVSIFDEAYPRRLTCLKNPPVVLNYRGDISFCNNLVTVTLSGTRHPTTHGYNVSMRLGELFASRNCVVVAGLAAGCGTAAHMGCLKAGGKTIAVVGHGLAHVYPADNASLMTRIIEAGGAIVSARFLHEKPRAEFFVERNLIQGGLCDFMVVTQTRPGSGIRHIINTAHHCKKEVYVYDPPAKYDDPSFAENKSLIHCNTGMPMASQEDIDTCLRKYQR